MNMNRPPVPPGEAFDPWDSRHKRRDDPHSAAAEFDEAMWNARDVRPATGDEEVDAYEERKKFFSDLGAPEDES